MARWATPRTSSRDQSWSSAEAQPDPRSVGGTHRQRVVARRVAVIREHPGLVGHGGRVGAGDQESRGRDVAGPARLFQRESAPPAPGLRAPGWRGLEVRAHRHVLLARQRRHRLGIVGREVGQPLRLLDARRIDASEVSLVVTTACLGPKLLCTASCMSSTPPDVDSWLAAKRVFPVTLLLTLISQPSARLNESTLSTMCWHSSRLRMPPGCLRRAAHARLPVLITLIPRNCAGTAPWLTALICPGCPLPSKNEPPIR